MMIIMNREKIEYTEKVAAIFIKVSVLLRRILRSQRQGDFDNFWHTVIATTAQTSNITT